MVAPITLEALRARRQEILTAADRHGARRVRVFGSFVRAEAGRESDVDFLVEFDRGRSLLDQVGLKQELEQLLGRPVDVVSEPALHWFIRERVLAEAEPL